MTDTVEVEVDGRVVEVSRPDKVLFSGAGVTKLELAEYHRDVAEVMVPHLSDRAVTVQRFPDGIEAGGFYQKQVPDHVPDWIDRVGVETPDGSQTQLVVSDAASLVYLADQAVITMHRWLSRRPALEQPDLAVFDLDPSDAGVEGVRRAARHVGSLLHGLGVTAGLMATGSTGFHVVVPIVPDAAFDDVRAVCRSLAAEMAGEHPDELTTEMRKEQRRGRVFVDYVRNSYGQTVVAPYSVRARPGAPVACPLDWDELGGADPDGHSVSSMRRRLGQKRDPWIDLSARPAELDDLRP